MRRILVIGNAGAGKSTFSQKLAQKLKLPLVHLDRLYWTGDWAHVERAEFDKSLQTELEKPQWIIDGNFNRTFLHRLQYCDAVFFFDLPTACCLWGITNRVLRNYGKTRSDMGGNCPEYFDKNKLDLYKNVLNFNKNHRKNYYELLSDIPGVKVTIFRSRKQADNYIAQL